MLPLLRSINAALTLLYIKLHCFVLVREVLLSYLTVFYFFPIICRCFKGRALQQQVRMIDTPPSLAPSLYNNPCDELLCQTLILVDSSEAECGGPRIGHSVTDPQQLLAAHSAAVTEN